MSQTNVFFHGIVYCYFEYSIVWNKGLTEATLRSCCCWCRYSSSCRFVVLALSSWLLSYFILLLCFQFMSFCVVNVSLMLLLSFLQLSWFCNVDSFSHVMSFSGLFPCYCRFWLLISFFFSKEVQFNAIVFFYCYCFNDVVFLKMNLGSEVVNFNRRS